MTLASLGNGLYNAGAYVGSGIQTVASGVWSVVPSGSSVVATGKWAGSAVVSGVATVVLSKYTHAVVGLGLTFKASTTAYNDYNTFTAAHTTPARAAYQEDEFDTDGNATGNKINKDATPAQINYTKTQVAKEIWKPALAAVVALVATVARVTLLP